MKVTLVFEFREVGFQLPCRGYVLDIAAALPIATSTPVTNLRQYKNRDLGYKKWERTAVCASLFLTDIGTIYMLL